MRPLRISEHKTASRNTLQQLLSTLIWQSSEEDADGDPLDYSYDWSDVDKSSARKVEKDYGNFVKMVKKGNEDAYEELMGSDNAEHDFILTVNGHGAGYWDGDYKHGEYLTELCKKFNEYYVYLGDDGTLYVD